MLSGAVCRGDATNRNRVCGYDYSLPACNRLSAKTEHTFASRMNPHATLRSVADKILFLTFRYE